MSRSIIKTAISMSAIVLAILLFGCEEEKEINQKPLVDFVNPTNNSEALSGDAILIKVNANDLDGEIIELALYINENKVASFTEYPFSYLWLTSDSDIGSHTLKAISTDNMQEESSAKITITIKGNLPVSDFVTDYQYIVLGTSIQFTDSTTYYPSSWTWEFGDGTTSAEQNPVHIYTDEGIYDIKLTVTNEYDSSELIKTGYIQVADNTVSDYDGNIYKVVAIGKQYWMAENLKSTHYADGTALVDGISAGDITGDQTTKYYFAYDNDESNVDIYGRLYTWAAIMNGSEGTNQVPSDVQGVCPDAWHVPSEAEWDELIYPLGGPDIAGGKLKARGYDYWLYPNAGATDEFKFSALPGGRRIPTGVYEKINYNGYFITTTLSGSNNPKTILFFHISSQAYYNVMPPPDWAHTVRCVKD